MVCCTRLQHSDFIYSTECQNWCMCWGLLSQAEGSRRWHSFLLLSAPELVWFSLTSCNIDDDDCIIGYVFYRLNISISIFAMANMEVPDVSLQPSRNVPPSTLLFLFVSCMVWLWLRRESGWSSDQITGSHFWTKHWTLNSGAGFWRSWNLGYEVLCISEFG